jgi:cell division protein FtsB
MARKKKLIYILIIVGLVLIFLPSFIKVQRLKSRDNDLQKAIIELQRSNALLSEEERKLQEDTDYVEKVARQKMGVTRKGEVIYKIVEEGGDNQ